MQQTRTLSLLCVAGELAVANRQITVAAKARRQGVRELAENKSIGRVQIAQLGIVIEAQYQAEVQAPKSQHYRAAAGRTSRERDAIVSAGGLINFLRQSPGRADDNCGLRPFPDSQDFRPACF